MRALGHEVVPWTSTRCTRWPTCSTTAPGWPSAMPWCRSCWTASPRRWTRPCARSSSQHAGRPPPTPSRPVPAARSPARAAQPVAQGRCADGAHRAAPPALCRLDADPLRVNAPRALHQLRQPAGLVRAVAAGRLRRRPALWRELHRPRRRTWRWRALASTGRRRRRPAGGRATGQRRMPQSLRQVPASEPWLPLAVVGAHLTGMPLNAQLLDRGATLIEATTPPPATASTPCPAPCPKAGPGARGRWRQRRRCHRHRSLGRAAAAPGLAAGPHPTAARSWQPGAVRWPLGPWLHLRGPCPAGCGRHHALRRLGAFLAAGSTMPLHSTLQPTPVS